MLQEILIGLFVIVLAVVVAVNSYCEASVKAAREDARQRRVRSRIAAQDITPKGAMKHAGERN